jgi:acylpyruvate hydrolase
VKAVRYRNASGEFRIGRLEDESIVDAGPAGEQGFVPTREAWTALAQAEGLRIPIGAVTLSHPVVPRKLICIGLNYRDHAEESELDIPAVPVIFAKWTTSLIGHGATIVIPREETRPDYEGELAVVMGAGGAVAGYAVADDLSARDLQRREPQWTRAKGFDGSCPYGPWITTADEVPDPEALALRTWVNGELRQEASTSDLIFGIEALVAFLRETCTLEPGDLILTGTPSGVGMALDPPRFLEPGDVVRIEIERLGAIEHRVV